MRLRVFVLFLALFIGTTAGHIYTIDSYLNYLVTKSIGSRGTLEIPKFMMTVEGESGRHYSKLGPGQSLVSLPMFWLGNLVEHLGPDNPAFRAYGREFTFPHASIGPGDGKGAGESMTPGRAAAKDPAAAITARPQTLIHVSKDEGARLFFAILTNALIVAALCTIFWSLLSGYGLSGAGSLGGAALLGLTTPLWIYSRDFFSEPLFAVALLGTFYLLTVGGICRRQARNLGKKGGERGDEDIGAWRITLGKLALGRIELAGLLSSLGILSRASFLPVVAIFAAYIYVTSDTRDAGWRRALKYIGYCLPGIAVLGIMNAIRFGSPLATGYHTAFDKGFSVPFLKGLAWNLASPYRSIFIYAPAALLFFFGLPHFAKRYRGQLLLILALVVYVFAVYSRWWAWHGGWCWGPRFFVPIIPLLLIPGLVAVAGRRGWLLGVAVALGIAGFVVQLAGVLINYTAAYDYWIKIGRLDWAEVDIHLFSPVTTHLKAAFVTSPAHYDLWLIQLWHVNRVAAAGLVAILTSVIVITLVTLVRKAPSRRGNSDCTPPQV